MSDIIEVEDKEEDYEDICYICRRPESIGGSMEIISFPAFEMIIHLPEHVEEEW